MPELGLGEQRLDPHLPLADRLLLVWLGGVIVEVRDEGRDAGVGLDLRGIEIEIATPDQPRFLTQVDNFLEEALEDRDA